MKKLAFLAWLQPTRRGAGLALGLFVKGNMRKIDGKMVLKHIAGEDGFDFVIFAIGSHTKSSSFAVMTRDTSRFKSCWYAGSRTLQVAIGKVQICCHAGSQNLVLMSTHPVLLGRVARLNVGETPDTPKREGQASPPRHLDIEASPSPAVTRVTYGNSQMERPSWTWRCFQMFIALLVVILTTWYPSYGVYGGEVAALMVSTGIAGLAAMWLYLIAPTVHTFLAACFLCLNWVEGLVTLSLIATEKGLNIQDGPSLYQDQLVIGLKNRWLLLLLEFAALQFLIQNRLQSLWPALNRPGCKVWLARCLWMEVASFFLTALCDLVVEFWEVASIARELFMYVCAPICFLIWIALVTVTLFRVVLMFQKALDLARQQGLAVAATFQACRGRSILQCTGVIISLTTSLMIAAVVFGMSFLQSSFQSFA